jgi:hypothetical protein
MRGWKEWARKREMRNHTKTRVAAIEGHISHVSRHDWKDAIYSRLAMKGGDLEQSEGANL